MQPQRETMTPFEFRFDFANRTEDDEQETSSNGLVPSGSDLN